MAGLFDTLIESGLSLYDKYKGRENMPINERIFLESTLDKSKSPITEKSLTKKELKELNDLIFYQYSRYGENLNKYRDYINEQLKNQKALDPNFTKQFKNDLIALNDFDNKKITPALVNFMTGERSPYTASGILEATGKNTSIPTLPLSITYDDYPTAEGQQKRSLGSGETSEGKLATFLGQFRYGVDPKTGNLFVKDTYDFNPPVNRFTQQALQPKGDVAASEAQGSVPYNILRAYAGRTIPPGSGREVYINLNYQDPLGDTTK